MTGRSPSAPERIWLLDYGSGECTWCDCPDPDNEDHEAVEYVRADTAAAAIEAWRQIATPPPGDSPCKV